MTANKKLLELKLLTNQEKYLNIALKVVISISLFLEDSFGGVVYERNHFLRLYRKEQKNFPQWNRPGSFFLIIGDSEWLRISVE